MTIRANEQFAFRDEMNECIDVTVMFPVIRFPKWIVTVWKVHGKPDVSESLALTFYQRERMGFHVPPHRFYLRNVSDEGATLLSPLWNRYPGLRLAIGMQLLLFHELPPVLKEPMERFVFSELVHRNPHLCRRLQVEFGDNASEEQGEQDKPASLAQPPGPNGV